VTAVAQPVTKTRSAVGQGVLGRASEPTSGLTDDASPWTPADVRRCGSLSLSGSLGLAVCALGTSLSKTYDRELLWTALALVALGITALGGAGWILVGLRAVRVARRDLLLEIAPRVFAQKPAPAIVDSPAEIFYCPFAVGKELVPAARVNAQQAGLRPCEVCSP
jgi:hypothetical protein